MSLLYIHHVGKQRIMIVPPHTQYGVVSHEFKLQVHGLMPISLIMSMNDSPCSIASASAT